VRQYNRVMKRMNASENKVQDVASIVCWLRCSSSDNSAIIRGPSYGVKGHSCDAHTLRINHRVFK
jgi:hypothetical protein